MAGVGETLCTPHAPQDFLLHDAQSCMATAKTHVKIWAWANLESVAADSFAGLQWGACAGAGQVTPVPCRPQ